MNALLERDPIRALIERAQAGDRAAFDQLALGFREGVKAAILSFLHPDLRSKIDAKEILQETMVQAFQSLARFEWQGEGSFLAWLAGIAKNVVHAAIRKRRPSQPLQIAVNIPSADVTPSRAARREERFDRLEASFKDLPEDYRTVLTLARLEGLPMKAAGTRSWQASPPSIQRFAARAWTRRSNQTSAD